MTSGTAWNRFGEPGGWNVAAGIRLPAQRGGVSDERGGNQQAGGSVAQRRGAGYEYDGNNGTGGAAPARVYRLTRELLFGSAGTAAGTIANGYDSGGNRTLRQVSGLTVAPVDTMADQTNVFDTLDLIDSDLIPNNFNTNYDANGNTLVDNGTPTGDLYDAENRLIARGTGIQIGYDDQGNRVSKTVSGATTSYLLDEQNPTGTPKCWRNTAVCPAALRRR